MKETLFRIGEMAKLNHVSTQTLRLYDKNHLLTPEYLDKDSGYRYYTLKQCAKLDLIHALKSCQLSLEQIKYIVELSDPKELLDILEKQTTVLSDQLYHLSVSRNNLLRIQKNLQVLNSLPPFGEVFYEYIPERKMDVQRTDFDFFTMGYEGYEKMLLQMQNYLHDNHLPPSYFINVGTIMKQDDFMKGSYTSHFAFIFVDELYPETESVWTLPQNTFMAITSDDPALEVEYAHKLSEEIKKQNMQPCGDYICEVLSQFPLNNSGKMIYKIQVPVQRV